MGDPKIPGWLTKLAGTAKYLPLETRQKMLPKVVGQLHKTGVLSQLTGDELSQSSVFMAHFLGGSGEPLELEISDEDWNKLIRHAPMGSEDWTPSTNPEYSAEEGWEWRQISPHYKKSTKGQPGSSRIAVQKAGGVYDASASEISVSLYNILGNVTTLRRREIGDGRYEYQIAEDFDLRKGTSTKEYESARKLPAGISKVIAAVFPEYLDVIVGDEDYYMEKGHEGVITTRALEGTAVPIRTSYIYSTRTEDMIMDSMTLEEDIFK